MALAKSTLENNLKKVFSDMKKAGDKAKDTDFSDGITKACKDFIEAGDITTVDAGTVSSGVFAGSGSGSISLTDSLMKTPIVTAMNSMKTMTTGGDSILATAIFSGLSAMVSAGKVETDVTGLTTPPPPATGTVPPSSGSAKGAMVCTYPTFVTELNQVFQDMIDKAGDGFNGDDYFADKLATLVNSYVSSGVVTTAGTGALSGTVGSGGIA